MALFHGWTPAYEKGRKGPSAGEKATGAKKDSNAGSGGKTGGNAKKDGKRNAGR